MALEHLCDRAVGERAERVQLAGREAEAAVLEARAGAREPRERPVRAEDELGHGRRGRRLEREQLHREGVHRGAIIRLAQCPVESRHQRRRIEIGVCEPGLEHLLAHACSPDSTTTPSTVAATPTNWTLRSRSPSRTNPRTPATTAKRLESTAGTATLPLPTPTMKAA